MSLCDAISDLKTFSQADLKLMAKYFHIKYKNNDELVKKLAHQIFSKNHKANLPPDTPQNVLAFVLNNTPLIAKLIEKMKQARLKGKAPQLSEEDYQLYALLALTPGETDPDILKWLIKVFHQRYGTKDDFDVEFKYIPDKNKLFEIKPTINSLFDFIQPTVQNLDWYLEYIEKNHSLYWVYSTDNLALLNMILDRTPFTLEGIKGLIDMWDANSIEKIGLIGRKYAETIDNKIKKQIKSLVKKDNVLLKADKNKIFDAFGIQRDIPKPKPLPRQDIQPDIPRQDIQPDFNLGEIEAIEHVRAERKNAADADPDYSLLSPPPNVDEETSKAINIYNRIITLAKKYNKDDELNDFVKFMNRFKDIIENADTYKATYASLYADNPEKAISWLRKTLAQSNFAGHPREQAFKESEYVTATINSIYPVFELVNAVLDDNGDAIITKMGETITKASTGVCIEDALTAMREGAGKFVKAVSQFDPAKDKVPNMSDLATAYRNDLCLKCLQEHDNNHDRSQCLRNELSKAALEEYLSGKLLGKVVKDGQIEQSDIQGFVFEYHDLLLDCGIHFDFIDEE